MGKMDTWSTPQYVFDFFNARYKYDLDLCAEPHNAKCADFCSLETGRDGLREDISGRRVWCNPPYSDIEPWVKLAVHGKPRWMTLLLPCRTDREWFGLCLSRGDIEFILGRLKFVPPPGWEDEINPKTGIKNKATSAEFECMAVHMGREVEREGWNGGVRQISIPNPNARKKAA